MKMRVLASIKSKEMHIPSKLSIFINFNKENHKILLISHFFSVSPSTLLDITLI